MKRKKLMLAMCVAMLVTLAAFSTTAATLVDKNGSTNDEVIGYALGEVIDDYEPNAPMDNDDDVDEVALMSYDPRINNMTTEVKDQGNSNVCWAFASNALMENAVLYKTGLKYSYSEESLRIVMSKLSSAYDYGYLHRDANGGSSSNVGVSYLTRTNNPVSNTINWLAPNLSSDIPYTGLLAGEVSWNDTVSSSYSNAYATDVEYLDISDANSVKNAILTNGAVYVRLCVKSSSYNSSTNSFYNKTFDPYVDTFMHGIACVGWDDNYSAQNFKSGNQPENDGAWLIKNSWGTTDTNDGYYWISYEDATLKTYNMVATVSDVAPVSKNETMLAYDFTPVISKESHNISSTTEHVCMANVYDVSNLVSDYGTINKVMFYSGEIGATYKIYVVPFYDDSVSLSDDLGSALAYGAIDSEGYITEELATPFILSLDTKKIAVIVKISKDYTDDNSTVFLMKETKSKSYSPVINESESYYCENGEWVDITDTSKVQGNYCIRPTLVRRMEITENSTLSTNELRYKGKDLSVDINLNGNLLYSIKNNGSVTLYEDNQFTRSGNTVTFKKSFLDSLSTDSPSEIVFNFTDGDSQTLTILPKHSVGSVDISGYSVVDGELTAVINADDGDDVNYNDLIDYQWYTSSDGESWSEISGADSRTYTPDEDDMLNYLRVEVSTAESVYLANSESAVCSESCRVYLCGDVNCNGNVDVDDATEMQKVLAELIESSDSVEVAGDVNQDGYLNIDDVTNIQKYIAGIKKSLPVK